jgi:CRP/FNR family transcriptional regulator
MDNLKQSLSTLFESELINEILQVGKIMHLSEGDTLMEYGKRIKFMPMIISGTIKVMRRDENNKEILLYYLTDSESCAMAYACCMEDKLSEIRAVAEDNVELIAIPHEKLDEWLIKYPSWKSYILNSFTQRFNELLKTIENIAFHKLDDRLITYLKKKSEVSGKTVLQLSHNEIADDLGTSRVVISRLLKHLENDKKVLLYRNEIKILSNL